jgi:hypothetical protein
LEEDKARVIVLEDVRGETVITGFATRADEFDDHAPEAQKVLDTVRVEGRVSSPTAGAEEGRP